MAWVEYELRGVFWLDDDSETSVDDDDVLDAFRRKVGFLTRGVSLAWNISTGGPQPTDVTCECGGRRNVRMYNAGDARAPDWVCACDDCDSG